MGRRSPFTDMTAAERRWGGVMFAVYLVALPWLSRPVFDGIERLTGWQAPGGVQSLLYYSLLAALAAAVFGGFLGRTARSFLARLPDAVRTLGIGLAAFCGLNVLSSHALALVFPEQRNLNDLTIAVQLGQSPRSMTVVLVFLAPFVEETLFRGYLFGNIREYSRPAAYAASSLLFAFLHVWPFAAAQHRPVYLLLMAQYMIPGLVMAWVYEKSGTLWTSVLLHGLVNALAVWSLV